MHHNRDTASPAGQVACLLSTHAWWSSAVHVMSVHIVLYTQHVVPLSVSVRAVALLF